MDIVECLTYLSNLFIIFILWTLNGYWAHRIAHMDFKYNLIRYFHLAHHTEVYPKTSFGIKWYNLLWVWDLWKLTPDAILTETLQAIILSYYWPKYGLPILAFHYVYEIFFADSWIDHNPNIKGPITKVFAIGEYHLKHHKKIDGNYGIYITLWDYLFGTVL